MIVDKSNDLFPVGMRVLAVDDDPICLRVLDTLLRKCQYHVTTTNQAITAVNLLRENKTQFDLVISDVHMPDMDGFKLLELVGLEMDLPVIMLSANGDTKLVMKGITHGACDYLLKPVRIEELKNIWQHVIRRKRNDQKNSKQQLQQLINRKRKDQEDGDEDDENVEDTLLNQKKPRVVWTVDLHRKFVSAVNHLGIDKAVPKKVLDLMNVEKLTRENVASHLQKYRLYLSRISHHHQANMPMDLGGFDSPFPRMTSLRGPAWLQNPNHNNWQTDQIPMSGSRSNIGHQNRNSPVLRQGWNIGGDGIDNAFHAQLNLLGGDSTTTTTMIQEMETNSSLVFDSGNDFRCLVGGDPFSIMLSGNDILQQPSSDQQHSFVLDQRKTPPHNNGLSGDVANNNSSNNVWSLEDLINHQSGI